MNVEKSHHGNAIFGTPYALHHFYNLKYFLCVYPGFEVREGIISVLSLILIQDYRHIV